MLHAAARCATSDKVEGLTVTGMRPKTSDTGTLSVRLPTFWAIDVRAKSDGYHPDLDIPASNQVDRALKISRAAIHLLCEGGLVD
jgi:hypothetical protein